jgi:hypothetical protein
VEAMCSKLYTLKPSMQLSLLLYCRREEMKCDMKGIKENKKDVSDDDKK